MQSTHQNSKLVLLDTVNTDGTISMMEWINIALNTLAMTPKKRKLLSLSAGCPS